MKLRFDKARQLKPNDRKQDPYKTPSGFKRIDARTFEQAERKIDLAHLLRPKDKLEIWVCDKLGYKVTPNCWEVDPKALILWASEEARSRWAKHK